MLETDFIRVDSFDRQEKEEADDEAGLNGGLFKKRVDVKTVYMSGMHQ